jgi:TorA maturation chaperone TorD/ferredoxin
MNPLTRATAYAALAAIFRPPSLFSPAGIGSDPAGTLLAALEAMDAGLVRTWTKALTLGRQSRPNNGSAEPFLNKVEGLATSLTQTYNRLFVGPQPPLAHPYESVYRTPNGRLMGDVTMQVVQAYAEAGLALADGRHDMPDHVAVELEFMAYLAGEEAKARSNGNEALVGTWLSRQVDFLRDHLTCWIPQFCHHVVKADPGGYYGQATTTLAAFVLFDLNHTNAAWLTLRSSQSLSPLTGSVACPLIEQQFGKWQVSFHPKRKIPCTLCGICAQVCRPRALRFVQKEWEVELTFDPARCDGCGYCRKYCPERILCVDPAPTGVNDRQARQLAASALVPCASCGASVAPEAMLNRILERFRRRKGDPADEAAIHLCHACKSSTVAAN